MKLKLVLTSCLFVGGVASLPLSVQAKATAEQIASLNGPKTTCVGAEKAGTKARGRPRLGVIPREVTLLPEHWDWLSSQPGGASVALRKLVHEARKAGAEREQQRHAQERAYRVMSALAGNFPGFEEASRALFAGKRDLLAAEAQAWPPDVLEYVLRLAEPANGAGTGKS